MASLSIGFAGRGRRGFIVVAALWILAALAALASVYAVYVANAATSISVHDDEIQAEALARSALELTAYQLLVAKEDKRPTRGQFEFRLGRANVAVEFCSEAARVDLNMSSKELLSGLFVALGASTDDAEQYADRIIGWRTKPSTDAQDKEASLYRTAGLSYSPRGAPFAHVEELGLVLGIPPALTEHAMPYVTVYSGSAEINVLDAAPMVIAALPGMTAGRLDQFLSQQQSLDAGNALGTLGKTQIGATTAGSRAIRVTVHTRFDDGRRLASEAVMLLGDGREPYRVLSWRDDVDPQALLSIRLTAGVRQ